MRGASSLGSIVSLSLIICTAAACSGGDKKPMWEMDAGMDAMMMAEPACGDGTADPGEACDDGNTKKGDGCSATCTVEAGYSCPSDGGACDKCGNGKLGSEEACDDGNNDNGDGCSAKCVVENGWSCPDPGKPCVTCGDGIIQDGEACDEGLYADDVGCSQGCTNIDDNYNCSEPGVACDLCGDGEITGDEACDDGNTVSGDGCLATCLGVESGWTCPDGGGYCTLCGDGTLDNGVEECDDGNFVSGDGCSETCMLEPGTVCVEPGVQCSVCGNGYLEFIAKNDNGTPNDLSDDFYDPNDLSTIEACDDGNAVSGDGCSDCTIDDASPLTWECPLPGVPCGLCGDGVVQEIETCDDGVDSSTGLPRGGDGCSADCTTVDPYYTCPATGGPCVRCGDGNLEAGLEDCDDGNNLSGDGCSRTCALETDLAWVCPTPGQPCELCGNGVKEAHEACDDGNTSSGDGCAGNCQSVGTNYNCFFDGFACAKCGDGVLQPGESCDEGQIATPSNLTNGCVNCQRTTDWVCPSAGSPCELCGDGIIGNGDPATAFETCDDGNTASGDGCSPQCQIEAGFVCNGSNCNAAACGDGFVAGSEECDDGNRNAGDGCSFLCRVEAGFDCSGSSGCRRTRCGDGIVEGDEQCDDAGAECTGADTISDGTACATEADYTACINDNGSCAPLSNDGCSSTCQLETGYKCDQPGTACTLTYCGDGLVEGTEQCDVGGATCVGATLDNSWEGVECTSGSDFDGCTNAGGSCTVIDANGCDTSCALKSGFKCESGVDCIANNNSADPASDCCSPTYCGDGVMEGTEECDDGDALCSGTGTNLDGTACTSGADFQACSNAGGACSGMDGDGCASDCTIEDFYRCKSDSNMLSTCSPFFEFVSIRRFQVQNVDPSGITYNPDRRSFGGHKTQGSQLSLEMCLDGTVIDQGNTSGGYTNGKVFAPDGSLQSGLPADCSTGADPCYDAPFRSDLVSSENLQTLRGATYDPVTGDSLFMYADGSGKSFLVQMPPSLITEAPGTIDPDQFGLRFNSDEFWGITVGEDGDLYMVRQPGTLSQNAIVVLPRSRDSNTGALLPIDANCRNLVNTNPTTATNCTSFDSTIDPNRTRLAASANVLDAIFTVPGEPLVGIFNKYLGAPSYTGYDLEPGASTPSFPSSNYFSFYDIQTMDAPKRSALPGVLFSLGTTGTSYVNPGQAAETAADGAAFIMCVSTNEDCQIFARACDTDSDCPPGASCNMDGANTSAGQNFCYAPGDARNDVYTVARDRYSECVSTGNQNGTDCTNDDSLCLANGGTCNQIGQFDPQSLDVLVNDSLSESACVDPSFDILSVCGDHVTQTYETGLVDGDMGYCPAESEPTTRGNIHFDDVTDEITYDAPDDGGCGFVDTFYYTVDLGGGVIDTAMVRVAVNCICGDGIVDGNEQCDDGAFNGDPGVCVQDCGGDPSDDVFARCSNSCLLNVFCGDGYITPPEQCDDRNTDNGDGCSSVCTRESICGNGIPELGEDCDDGNNVTGDGCNPNCTIPYCGDGNRDMNEQCDDGNRRTGDGCDANCNVESRCGNKVVEPGEDCDDGNTISGDGCSATCKVEGVCGNDLREGSESCDGADYGTCPIVDSMQIQCINSVNGANNICKCQNYCGDGKIGGMEECDDGMSGSSTCRGHNPSVGNPCTTIRCGDGVLDAGEICDDGNSNTADLCDNTCKPRPNCGDGNLDTGEECDDGNNVDGDGCASTCIVESPTCGDGVVDLEEGCDDGNNISGDGCSSNCRLEAGTCGDGTVDTNEQCDDGNNISGDGCSADCFYELL